MHAPFPHLVECAALASCPLGVLRRTRWTGFDSLSLLSRLAVRLHGYLLLLALLLLLLLLRLLPAVPTIRHGLLHVWSKSGLHIRTRQIRLHTSEASLTLRLGRSCKCDLYHVRTRLAHMACFYMWGCLLRTSYVVIRLQGKGNERL